MKVAEFLPAQPDALWQLAPQLGVTHAVCRLPDDPHTWTPANLAALRQRFNDHGLEWTVVEPLPPSVHQAIKLGLPDRERALERACALVQTLGVLGVNVLCYNFMAGIGWTRTDTGIRARGGALVSGYDHAQVDHSALTEWGEVSPEALWENLHRFLERVVPVAESAGVRLALHPDDPPVARIRGIGRILISPEAVRRALDLVPSPNSGLTFCQGTFRTMGADVPALVRSFRGQIFFVHFRDTRGTPDRFTETFHDDGPTDMLAAMRAYREIGFNGPVRVDHVPTMHGEVNDQPGYGTLGRLFAHGYLRGLLEATALGAPMNSG